MKLVICIPAYNEEDLIGKTVRSIPKKFSGIDDVKILVINDGSNDKTVELAMNAGADKIVSHKINSGVGAAFMTGVRNAITMGADILVSFDADSQFDPKQISNIIIPLLNNEVDVVIGSRFLKNNPKMPMIKLIGNKIFSKIVSFSTGQYFSDTQTGFRAYSRKAIKNITVINDFTYTQEVLIDLKFKGFRIGEIPINVFYNDKRKSKVVKNIFSYTQKALSIIVKSLIYHRPILVFGILFLILSGGGILAKILAIWKILGVSAGLSTGFIILGIVSLMLGILASAVFNRQKFVEKDLRHHINELEKFRE